MEINSVLNNQNNMYFGHGTGTENPDVINSIMNNGLRCSHESLYFTTVVLGMGGQIQESEQEMLRSWPHKESQIIVVVSLPIQYKIIDIMGTGTYNKGDAAYYYTPDEERRKSQGLTDSPYVMPEFVAGYYDARTDSFTPNPRYYEYLPAPEQAALFDRVKQNYFGIVNDGWGIEEYIEVANDLGWIFGLTEEEVTKFRQMQNGDSR